MRANTITRAGDVWSSPSAFVDADDAEWSLHGVSTSTAVDESGAEWKGRPASAGVVTSVRNHWRLRTLLRAAALPRRNLYHVQRATIRTGYNDVWS